MTATHQSLVADFRALGVAPGDIIMLHASYRAVRPVEGGPETVIEALIEAVGPKGGVAMFPSWLHSPYDAFLKGGPTLQERAEWPAFDPDAAPPVHPERGGALGACLAARPDAVRSRNPDRSLVGVGAAAPLMRDQPYDHGFGPGSPLEKLCKAGGKTLNLGAPLYTATILHYAEYLANVPGKLTTHYEVPIVVDGRKEWRAVKQMNRDHFVDAAAGLEPDYLEQVIGGFIAGGRHREARVGAARALLYDMKALVPFAKTWFERRFG